jgi:type II secretory pathway component GspD/PulD (secretin)
MNKLITKLTVCAVLVFTTCICTGEDSTSSGQAQSASSEQAVTTQPEQAAVTPVPDKVVVVAADVGRGDPFGDNFSDNSLPQTNVAADVKVNAPDVNKPPLIVRMVSLKFLNAANLKTAIDKMSSTYGSISVNESTNSLIVCDTEESVNKILIEIQKADLTPKQIMIEVLIIDVQLQNNTEIGVDWDILSSDNKDFSYRQSTVFPDRLSVIAPTTATIDSMTAYQNTGLGAEVAIVTSDIRNVLHLLQEKKNVDIIASPRVLVVSGQKAEIKTVEEIPYQEKTDTSQGGLLTSTQFKEVGVTMEVKASVTDEGKILLTVSPSQSVNTGTSISGVPVIDTRKATTTLLMDDGQLVVMGGLRRQDTQITKNQVPLLGDLPLFGFIFSSNKKSVTNAELLVLLSPHIYKGESAPAEGVARLNEIRNRPVLSLPAEPNLW